MLLDRAVGLENPDPTRAARPVLWPSEEMPAGWFAETFGSPVVNVAETVAVASLWAIVCVLVCPCG